MRARLEPAIVHDMPETDDGSVLYDNPGSSNGLKVRFLLAELGREVRRVVVPLGPDRPAWYRDVHPFATVPCLVDGDLVLVESNTILRYLADRAGRADLYPRDPAERARVDQLLDALSLQVRPALWEAELLTIYGDGGLDAARSTGVLDDLADVLGAWDRLLATAGYATGRFSIADCAIAARLTNLTRMPIDLARFPATWRLLETVCARPAFLAAAVWRP